MAEEMMKQRPVAEQRHMNRLPEWFKDISSVGNDQIRDFYRKFTKDFEAPLFAAPVTIPGSPSFQGVVYVPHHDSLDVYHFPWSQEDRNVSLYAGREAVGEFSYLLPKYLNFIKAIINTEEGVDRNMVFSDQQLRQRIRDALINKSFEMFDAMAPDYVLYERFHGAFASYLKQCVHDDFTLKEQVARYFRFFSSRSPDRLITLDDYLAELPPSQRFIIAAAGRTPVEVQSRPLVKTQIEDGRHVLFAMDPPYNKGALLELGQYRGHHIEVISAQERAPPPYCEDPLPACKDYPARRHVHTLPAWFEHFKTMDDQALADFYQDMTEDVDIPLYFTRVSIVGDPSFEGVIFVPRHDNIHVYQWPWINPDHNLAIYSNREFVTEQPMVLPRWLGFVKGIINTTDEVLPEEILKTSVMSNIRDTIISACLRMFHEIYQNATMLEEFHGAFAPYLKKGVHEHKTHHDEIASFMRFNSNKFLHKLVSLDDYMGRNRGNIKYVVGKVPEDCETYPSVRAAAQANEEVLFACDPPYDKQCMHELGSYKGTPLQPLEMKHVDTKGPEMQTRGLSPVMKIK